ncbi:unnamed protein product [Toxocara canis]|uniref:Uncharacterized protein n=1 Tax=Toxocara canis TaxID=6265 RepID=A0A183UPG1_TOXCA|nr:unnamed protein product [Toxocara canis]
MVNAVSIQSRQGFVCINRPCEGGYYGRGWKLKGNFDKQWIGILVAVVIIVFIVLLVAIILYFILRRKQACNEHFCNSDSLFIRQVRDSRTLTVPNFVTVLIKWFRTADLQAFLSNFQKAKDAQRQSAEEEAACTPQASSYSRASFKSTQRAADLEESSSTQSSE